MDDHGNWSFNADARIVDGRIVVEWKDGSGGEIDGSWFSNYVRKTAFEGFRR